ncbi:probable ADP-ribosylation factor GTPase-activating protein AGD14 [Malania oleifera]|uniref:probable ADP-ribosylation factor GTPase-activating protein AGD14 n=1 Tax=Malania oleifera TaxID=397392 RepID=UPI0025AEC75C|nr:probable ADP-ribosylation factor GTPase-activating protein AGD14 [Malania oleifera]
MATRVKEDEKNERIIRGLLKLPENRRCINCNSLGPQYVCTNFWTFVCTTCSGIHREFTHRVKSVSMAKFTTQEVSALQGGGNARAREIYFKELDSQRHSSPDSSNVDRLRDFIKHVYVDKRYTGERNLDKPPRAKMGEKEDYENRRVDTYQVGSRSPPYEDTYDRRYSGKSSPGGRSDDKNFRDSYDGRRSPGYEQENRQYGDHKRSPIHSEVVNDWRREDRFGNGRRSEDRRIYEGDSKLEGRSPDRQKDPEVSSPPIVRPVRDILGENVSPLRIIEPPKYASGKVTDGSAQTQRTVSSSSLGSLNGNQVESKGANLIDFDVDPEPSVTAAAPQAQQTSVALPISKPTGDENWASFDFAAETKVSQAPTHGNTLESVLSQFSAPQSVPGQISGMPPSGANLTTAPVGNMPVLSSSGDLSVASLGYSAMSTYRGGPPAAPANNFSTYPPTGTPAANPVSRGILPISGGSSAFVKSTDMGQWSSMQHQQHTLFPATGTQPAAQLFAPVSGGLSNQMWNSSVVPSTQGLLTTPGTQLPQAVPQQTNSVVSQSAPGVSSGGRKELPADLFAPAYSSNPVPTPGWQTGPPRGMGFTMQYNTAAAMPTFLQHSMSTNPFDLHGGPPSVQAPAFPSMASLQGALPNMPPSTSLLRTSSVGSPTWMTPQSSPYASALPPQAPTSVSAMPLGLYMGQQVPGSVLAARHQGLGGFSNEGAAFGALNPNPQLVANYSAPAAPGSLSSPGGNPFA